MTKVKRFSKKATLLIVCFILIVFAVSAYIIKNKASKVNILDFETTVARVTRGDIVNSLKSSGSIEAIDQYEITSLIGGEIIGDYFNEGDYVEEGQLLYEIDKSSILKSIDKATNSLKMVEMSLSDSKENLSDLTITSPTSCVVTSVYIKNGDQISNGAKICDYIDSSNMTLTINFLASEAKNIYTGESATVEIIGTSDVVYGTVESVSTGSLTNSLGSLVSNIKISVSNAGGITENTKATAYIGTYACAEPGTFSNFKAGTITSKQSGKVENFNLNVGDKLSSEQTPYGQIPNG